MWEEVSGSMGFVGKDLGGSNPVVMLVTHLLS